MPIPEVAWKALVNMYGTDGSPMVTISHLESEEKMACDTCHVSQRCCLCTKQSNRIWSGHTQATIKDLHVSNFIALLFAFLFLA
jgi:hypothetical protein